MEELLHQQWDARYWDMALKLPRSVDVYNEMKAAADSAVTAVPIDELPPEDKDWLRSTR